MSSEPTPAAFDLDLDAVEAHCEPTTPDAEFTTMARQAVPQLVAEVRRLRWLLEYGACPTAGTTGTEFVLPLNEEMLAYFREMADVLVEHCAISRAEAVARINATYGAGERAAWGVDIMGHELPSYWAYGTYYGPDPQGRVPVGDPAADVDIDFSAHPVWPAPPKDSPFWTLEE